MRRGVCVCPMRGTGGGGGAWLPKTAVGGGGGAAVDREEVNDGERVKKEKKKKEKSWGRRTPFPEIQCGAETPRSLVELNLLSH